MMFHKVFVAWRRDGAVFIDGKYSRVHWWRFDGGAEIAASASPAIVPLPLSSAELVDPEEAFVAALSSCHMLFFLEQVAAAGAVVESYEDHAVGEMGEWGGKTAIIAVRLRPHAVFLDTAPPAAQIDRWHHAAHERCFIANSVKTAVTVELPESG